MLTAIRGKDASLKWEYYPAADLRNWTITSDEGGRTLTATVLQSDAYRLSQRPLVFAARHPKGTWKWSVLELQISGASLTAKLGPREI